MNTTSLFNDDIFEAEFSFEELDVNAKITMFMDMKYTNKLIKFIEEKRTVIEETINNKDKNQRQTISDCIFVAFNCFLGDEFETHPHCWLIGDKIFGSHGISYEAYKNVCKKYIKLITDYGLQNFTSKYKKMNQ